MSGRTRAAWVYLWVVLMLSHVGCSPQAGAGHEHGEHGHAHAEDATVALTHWGDKAQLFVEFKALVAGQTSEFAVHLTQLQGHRPISDGRVTVELSGSGSPVERFSVEGTKTPGIFKVAVRPEHPGPRTLVIKLEGGELSEGYELGERVVFGTRAGANVGTPSGSEGGITYLLEQQWRRDFSVVQTRPQALSPNIAAFGTLSAPASSNVTLSAPSAGRISLSEALRVGGEVARGQALFVLSQAGQERVDMAQLNSAITSAQIEVESYQREYERLEPLAQAGVIAKARLTQAKRELDLAQARLGGERARRAQALSQQRLKGGGQQISVPSPIEGTLMESYVSDGVWVERDEPLGVVARSGSLWLDVAVPEAYVAQLEGISGVWWRSAQDSESLELGEQALVSVGQALDERRRTLPVRFELKAPGPGLYAGMAFPVRLLVGAPKRALAIPQEAVIDDAGDEVVFVQLDGERFERRVVRLGVRDRGQIEVLEGLVEGDWVAARGAYAIRLASTSTATIGHGHAH